LKSAKYIVAATEQGHLQFEQAQVIVGLVGGGDLFHHLGFFVAELFVLLFIGVKMPDQVYVDLFGGFFDGWFRRLTFFPQRRADCLFLFFGAFFCAFAFGGFEFGLFGIYFFVHTFRIVQIVHSRRPSQTYRSSFARSWLHCFLVFVILDFCKTAAASFIPGV
jgi:hypothetical protein